ncbi:exonuclease III [Bacillus cereus]
MKFISWNVNGLRAVIAKGGFIEYLEEVDAKINSEVMGSDHCPIELNLEM